MTNALVKYVISSSVGGKNFEQNTSSFIPLYTGENCKTLKLVLWFVTSPQKPFPQFLHFGSWSKKERHCNTANLYFSLQWNMSLVLIGFPSCSFFFFKIKDKKLNGKEKLKEKKMNARSNDIYLFMSPNKKRRNLCDASKSMNNSRDALFTRHLARNIRIYNGGSKQS